MTEVLDSNRPEDIVISFDQGRLTIGADGKPKLVSSSGQRVKDRTAERLRVLGHIIKHQGTRSQFLVDTSWRDSGQDPAEFEEGTRQSTNRWIRRLQTSGGERLILEDKIQDRTVMHVNPKFRLLPDLALAQALEVLYEDVGKNWGEL